jgi:hypothetical protein
MELINQIPQIRAILSFIPVSMIQKMLSTRIANLDMDWPGERKLAV